MEILISFRGGLADNHRIPAIEGSQSIEGAIRTFALISNYAVTGKVRFKAPFSENFDIQIAALQQGSFQTKLVVSLKAGAIVAAMSPLGVDLAKGAAGNFIYDLSKYIYSTTIGQTVEIKDPSLQYLKEKRDGDLEALREAITPSAKRAHAIIGNGAKSIIIIGDGNNLTIFDKRSKDHLDGFEVDENIEVKVVSVSMFNANGRNGRVFDYELNKNISFYVDDESEARTTIRLAQSLLSYTKDREKSQVYIKYKVARDPSGKPIKYFIVDAWLEEENSAQ